jgi:Family of unknown function (DUF6152)
MITRQYARIACGQGLVVKRKSTTQPSSFSGARSVSLKAAFPAWRNSLAAIAAVGLLGVSVQSSAHHAFAAEFDADQPIDLKGAVTKVKWVNPHSWLYFDVKTPDGTVTNWGVEFGAPNQLARIGLKKTDVAIGTEVHIKGYRAKNGGSFGYSVTVTFADGRTFKTGGAQDAPSARTAALQSSK